MLEVEATGKNIEQAITNALFELKALREDVDIKIIEQGGFFKKAKVLVKISDDALGKYQKVKSVKEEIKNEIKEERTSKIEEKTEQITETKNETNANEQEVDEVKTSKQNNSNESEAEIGKEFLEGILSTLGNNATVFVEEKADEICYEIKGEKASELIGYRGESLNSLQYLVSIINSKNNRHSKRVRLDIDGFKERRKATLEALAHRIAKKVEKTGHPIKLEPMTAYERRIIHTIIQEYETLDSLSQGVEPNRFLTIKKKTN